MQETFGQLVDKLYNWGESAILMLPNFVIAVLVVLLFYFLARYAKKLFLGIFSVASENIAVTRLLSNILTFVIIGVGTFVALGILDLNKTVTSLLAGAGVVGLAIGLAFQDPILNIISGILLTVKNRPFNIGDLIETNDVFGHVTAISLRSTNVHSLTGQDIVVPNKMMIQNNIVNYTLTPKRRVDVECSVAYNSDLDNVQKVSLETIRTVINPKDERIEFMYTKFGDSSINFVLRYWLEDAEQTPYLKSRSEAIIALKKAFDREGISIPFPIRVLEFKNPEVFNGAKTTP